MPIILIALILVLHCLNSYAENEVQQKTQIWDDGTKYSGSVLNGKREGKGTIIWPDGSRYTGYFKNDLRNGPGTLILPDGKVYNGYFVDDELTEPPSSGVQIEAESAQQPPPSLAELFPPVTELSDEVKELLHHTLDMWAKAWSDQNAEQYLAYYDADFKVPAKLSRRQWEILRRSRIKRPSQISIDLQFTSFEITGTNIAKITVQQKYKSNLFNDVTVKVIRLKRDDRGDWKILSEQVVK